jgi:hypothetical protein
MPWQPLDGDEFPSLGFVVADWLEQYTCHGPGDVQGEPLVLDREWLKFLVHAYRLDPATGGRVFDEAVLSRPKGRAKSELAGLIGVVEAFGPVRFDGWDADGQPVGRPVTSPLLKCLATEESQAGNTFENIAFIAADWGPDVHPDVYKGVRGARQYQSASALYLPHGGEIRASTAGSASKDGGKECAAGVEGDVRDGAPQPGEAEVGAAVDVADDDGVPAGGSLDRGGDADRLEEG